MHNSYKKIELHSQRLILRELSRSDLTDIHNLHSISEVDKYNTLGIPDSIEDTESLLTQWIAHQNADPRPAYVLSVNLKQTGAFIGLAGLKKSKPGYHSAEIWYKTLPAHWSQGYTTEAMIRLLSFGFQHLNLHRVEAGCAVENSASIRVLEKIGMTREGRHKKILPIRGEWVDNYSYAILDDDFA